MRNFTHLLNPKTIKNKLLLSYVLLMLIPLLLITFIFSSIYRKNMLEKVVFQTSLGLEGISTRMADSFGVVGSVLNQILLDPKLEEVSLKNYSTTLERFNGYGSYKGFAQLEKSYAEINTIRLYALNDTMIENGFFTPIDASYLEKPWFQKVLSEKGKITWVYDAINSDAPSYHLLYELRGTSTYQKLGVVAIEINEAYLSSFIEEEFFNTLVFVPSGEVLLSNQSIVKQLPYIESSELPSSQNFSLLEEGLYNMFYQEEPTKVILQRKKIDYLNTSLTFVTVINNQFITQDMVSGAFPLLLILIFSCACSVLLIVFFTDNISSRMTKLGYAMDRIAKGDFDVTLDTSGEDEIAKLYTNVDQMKENIRILIEKVYTSSLHQKELLLHQKDIQLKMLLYQMNPHFLFNTLEAIRMSAHTQNNIELAEVIEALAFMLRSNLDRSEEFVPLADEIELLENYLKIMHFRLGDRVSYRLNIPPSLYEHAIPYFILQPLVENAITHGLEGKEKGGHITIAAWASEKNVILMVEDDGVGMSQEALQALQASLLSKDAPSQHIGLLNIHQRLQLIYGKVHGLTITSQKEKGTRVELSLPLIHPISFRKEL